MISNAQLAQLATKFTKDILQYHKNKKYFINLCLDSTYESYYNWLLSNNSCIDTITQCELSNIADNLDYNDDVTTIPCSQQLNITFTRAQGSCTDTLVLKNLSNGSNYPRFYTTTNSEYLNSAINLVNTSLCNPSTVEINGGCLVVGCSNLLKSTTSFSLTDTNTTLPTNGYLSRLYVYETDQNGNFINSQIELDLNPTTSPYYSGAGLTTLTASDVVFSNASWTGNMVTLMNNVSIYRYGVTGKHKLTFNKVFVGASFRRISINTTMVHNPTTRLFGVNKSNGAAYVFIPSTGKETALLDTSAVSITSTNFYSNNVITTNCGTVVGIVDGISRPKINGGASNFNVITLIDNYGDIPLTLYGTTTNSCSFNTVTAVYNPVNVVSVAWLNGDNDNISYTDTANLTSQGLYTFVATLANGCTVSKYYTYTWS